MYRCIVGGSAAREERELERGKGRDNMALPRQSKSQKTPGKRPEERDGTGQEISER